MSKLSGIEDLIVQDCFLEAFTDIRLQLQKDVYRSGISYTFTKKDLHSFIIELRLMLRGLLNDSFSDFVNLLYAVDVSENKIRFDTVKKSEEILEIAIGLLIKREWDKVRFRNDMDTRD